MTVLDELLPISIEMAKCYLRGIWNFTNLGVVSHNEMLLYPLYASVQAIESPAKLDDEQWLAYWIEYSFLTLMEMMIQPLLKWVPIWYPLKVLAFVAWLVLPQFKGAAFIYEKFVRERPLRRNCGRGKDHGSPKGKKAS